MSRSSSITIQILSLPWADPGFPLHTIHTGLDLNPEDSRHVGWRSAISDLCVLIDDDNVVGPEAIDQLALVFEDVGVGFAGPLSSRPILEGSSGVARHPSVAMPDSLASQRPVQSAQHVDVTYEDMPDAFVVPRTVLETLGGFDEERFPM